MSLFTTDAAEVFPAILGGQPVADKPFPAINPFGIEELGALRTAMDSGPLSGFLGSPGPGFLGGPLVRAFEAAWAERFGVAYAVSVNSATSGLIAAVGAARIGPGDEVVVPPFTMSATAIAPLVYGGIPVFADIDSETFCIDPDSVRAAVSSRTKAVIAVNLFGHPSRLRQLRQLADEHGFLLIEDNSQSPLASEDGCLAGTIGHIGVFSLNVHKHINTGEGGMCVTSDPDLALRMQLIRNHGENVVDQIGVADLVNLYGFNLRMTELTAAIGIEQLRKLDANVKLRVAIAEAWTEELGCLEGIIPPVVRVGCEHVFLTWAFRYDEVLVGVPRARFSEALAAEGIPHGVGYVRPLYLLPVFQHRIATGSGGFPFALGDPDYRPGRCPNAERLHDHELLLLDTCAFDPGSGFNALAAKAIRKVYAHRNKLAGTN